MHTPHLSSKPAIGFRRLGLFRFSMPEFLASLALLLVAAPFVEELAIGEAIESFLMTLVLVSGVMAVGKNRRILLFAGLLAVPAALTKWLSHAAPTGLAMQFHIAMALLFILFILSQLIRFILRSPRVNSDVLCAGLSMYLLIGMTWALAYRLAEIMAPGSFIFSGTPAAQNHMTGFTTFYFSFITLTTVGYGDIAPATNITRMLASAEAITGTLFVAVFIARLVALYSTTPQPETRE